MRSGVTLSSVPSPDSHFSSPGDPIRSLFRLGLEDGHQVLVEDGRINIPDFINAWRESTDMAFILSRINAGDTSVLSRKPCFYADSTVFPSNPADGLKMMDNAVRLFDSLPEDVRAKFDNDALSWVKSAGSADWLDKMSIKVSSPSSESEVNHES